MMIRGLTKKMLLTGVATGVFFGAVLAARALANPSGADVLAGQVGLDANGNTLTITQHTNTAIINWQSFDIAPQEATRFVQPSADAVALNRVLNGLPSQLEGELTANGRVFLVNPAGVVVGQGARLDVQGFVASAADVADADFLAGDYHFATPAPVGSSIVNQGLIHVREGGELVLAAPTVRNDGTIDARLARVSLSAANTLRVDFEGDGLLTYDLGAAAGAQAENTGIIRADGGVVALTAQSQDAVTDSVINQAGVVQARSVGVRNGKIILDGGARGVTDVRGPLDARGDDAGESGGSIDVTGDIVAARNGARLDASGAAGGGTIRFGAGVRGEAVDHGNGGRVAQRALVERTAQLSADAQTHGDGGTISVWSVERTAFLGAISSRGGAQGGAGGFAEVSAKGDLLFDGRVDLAAPAGALGHFLLDPRDVNFDTAISGSNDTEVSDSVLNRIDGGTSVDFSISADAVQQLLGSFTIEADRDINFTVPLNLVNLGVDETATFRAGNNINIQQSISAGAGNLFFHADSDFLGAVIPDGTGDINVMAALTTNGGSIDLVGGVTTSAGASFNAGTGIVAVIETPNGIQDITNGSFVNLVTAGQLFVGRDSTLAFLSTQTIVNAAIAVPTTINQLALFGDTNVTINANITGNQSLAAGTGLGGDVVINAVLNAGAQSVNVETDNLTITAAGQVNANTIFLGTRPDSSIDVLIGNLTPLGTLIVDLAELSRLNPTGLLLIQSANNLTFDSVTATSSANIPNWQVSSALDIDFTGSGNSFRAFQAEAGSELNINAPLEITENFSGGLGALFNVNVNAPVSLSQTTANFFFEAAEDININQPITSAGGNLFFEADFNFGQVPFNGLGDTIVNAPISSNGGIIELANGFDLFANVSSGAGSIYIVRYNSPTESINDFDGINFLNTPHVFVGRNFDDSHRVQTLDISATLTAQPQIGAFTAAASNSMIISGTLNFVQPSNFNVNNGALNIFGTVSAPGQNVSIQAQDMEISVSLGTLSAANIFINASPAGSTGIHIGQNLPASGAIRIGGLELSRITATTALHLNTTAGSVILDGVAQAQSAGIFDWLITSTQQVNFNGSNSVRRIQASANGGVTVSQDLFTTEGRLTLISDADGAGNEAVSVFGALTAAPNQLLTLGGPDFVASSTSSVTASGGGHVLISPTRNIAFGLTGPGVYAIDGLEFLAFNTPELTIITQPGGTATLNDLMAGSSNTAVLRLEADVITFNGTNGPNVLNNLLAFANNGITVNGTLSLTSPGSDVSFDADADSNGVGTFTLNGTIAGQQNVFIRAATLNQSAGASVTATDSLHLRPISAGSSIGIDGGTGTFQIAEEWLSTITGPGSTVRVFIGNMNGSHTTNTGTGTLNIAAPVEINLTGAGGTLSINGSIAGTGRAALRVDAAANPIFLGGNITTASGILELRGTFSLPTTGLVALSTVAGGAGAEITLSGNINGGAGLALSAGVADVFLSGSVNNTQPLASFSVNGARHLFLDTIITAGAATLNYSGAAGDFSLLPIGRPFNPLFGTITLNVSSLTVGGTPQTAELFGTINGVGGASAAALVNGPLGNPALRFNACPFGIDCNAPPPAPLPPSPPPQQTVNNNPSFIPPVNTVVVGVVGGVVPPTFGPPPPPPPANSGGTAGGDTGGDTAQGDGEGEGGGEGEEGGTDVATGGAPVVTEVGGGLFDTGFGGQQTAAHFTSGEGGGQQTQSFEGWGAFQVPDSPPAGYNPNPNSLPPSWPNFESWQ